jgi:regulator of replication initiation timing
MDLTKVMIGLNVWLWCYIFWFTKTGVPSVGLDGDGSVLQGEDTAAELSQQVESLRGEVKSLREEEKSLKAKAEKTEALRGRLNDLATALEDLRAKIETAEEGAKGETPAASNDKLYAIETALAELKRGQRSVALHILGDAPPNQPSTVVRTPKEHEKMYDGLTDAQHLGGSIELDTDGVAPGLWNFLMKAINVQSVVDVGCGRGVSSSWFLAHGADLLCVEGANDAIDKSYLPKEKIVAHDFYKAPYWPSRTFDLAWCIEVLEHISREHMANYQSIFHKSAIILASHSAWGGHHHVEVHQDWWWLSRMELAGFVYSERLTKLFRKVAQFFAGDSGESQHVVITMHVYINPKVASLPEHAHLFGMFGCYVNENQDMPCPEIGRAHV